MAGVRITPKDLSRFTTGDCDVLADELHKLTGWPIYTLHSSSLQHGLHAFVLAPGKIAVDIKGPRPIRQLVKEWSQHGARGYVKGCWRISGVVYSGSRQRAQKLAPFLAAQVR